MASSVFETVFTQIVLPTLTSPELWGLASILAIWLLIRRVYLPCITLQGLKSSLKQVKTMLDAYKNNLDREVYYDYSEYTGFQQQWRQIEKDANTMRVFDLSIGWKKNFSLSRALDISRSYKKSSKLREDIEHSRAIFAKKRDELTMQP